MFADELRQNRIAQLHDSFLAAAKEFDFLFHAVILRREDSPLADDATLIWEDRFPDLFAEECEITIGMAPLDETYCETKMAEIVEHRNGYKRQLAEMWQDVAKNNPIRFYPPPFQSHAPHVGLDIPAHAVNERIQSQICGMENNGKLHSLEAGGCFILAQGASEKECDNAFTALHRLAIDALKSCQNERAMLGDPLHRWMEVLYGEATVSTIAITIPYRFLKDRWPPKGGGGLFMVGLMSNVFSASAHALENLERSPKDSPVEAPAAPSPQHLEAHAPRVSRHGRKAADSETCREEHEMAESWKRAKANGTSKAEFADDVGLTVKKLNNLIDRVRKRQNPSE